MNTIGDVVNEESAVYTNINTNVKPGPLKKCSLSRSVSGLQLSCCVVGDDGRGHEYYLAFQQKKKKRRQMKPLRHILKA